MSFINYSSREINCKIVYYGPGLCGKTTNLQYIYAKTNPEAKGKMISLATETERTLFFDFLPLSLGEIRGCASPTTREPMSRLARQCRRLSNLAKGALWDGASHSSL